MNALRCMLQGAQRAVRLAKLSYNRQRSSLYQWAVSHTLRSLVGLKQPVMTPADDVGARFNIFIRVARPIRVRKRSNALPPVLKAPAVLSVSIQQVNFLITQFLALILASVFRSYLHPSKVTASTRHAIGLVIGLFFGYFCFGQQAIHIAGLPAVCYVVIRTQNPQIVQRLVMVVALAYLSCIHLHRQYYDYGSYSLDITGPLMIITQKVTSLAFSIHDGFTREMKDLTRSQEEHAIRKLPSALEFFSYTLHFQGLMAGPLVFYKDDLMRMNENNEIFISAETLRKRQQSKAEIHSGSDHVIGGGGVDAFLKKEIDALNAAVQQVNVLPAVLSNGHAK
ncbi:lysophospholipid acyltransferase 6-like [Aedes albopictus]|uniref:Transmembrane protein 135 N-terminal domain-containing protein n=1 Tax=Aedes albopictus TaxID=7160 RepID=A0ABM1YKK3_AEDAL